MRKTPQVLGVFVSSLLALFGIVLLTKGLGIVKGPLPPNSSDWVLYHLYSADTFEFYVGCVIVAASLTFLWAQRLKVEFYVWCVIVAASLTFPWAP
jgi:hypothetical protein